MAKKKKSSLRLLSMAAILLILFIGSIFNTGLGTYSSWGLKDFYLNCPLGFLEYSLAGHTFLLHPFIAFLLIAVFTVALGRAFCGWICPVPLTRKIVLNKVDEPVKAGEDTKNDSRTAYGVLVGTLLSAGIFGFPVFCLICPIGLIMGTLLALSRLVGFNEPAWDLLVFPLVLVLELLFLRRWCSKICPVGAILTLISRLNKTYRPTVDSSKCLESQGIACGHCQKVCAFGINLHKPQTDDLAKCSKCHACSDNCPKNAISFPWSKKDV